MNNKHETRRRWCFQSSNTAENCFIHKYRKRFPSSGEINTFRGAEQNFKFRGDVKKEKLESRLIGHRGGYTFGRTIESKGSRHIHQRQSWLVWARRHAQTRGLTAYAMFIPQLELSIQNHAVGKNTHPLHLRCHRLPKHIERTQGFRYPLRRRVHVCPLLVPCISTL